MKLLSKTMMTSIAAVAAIGFAAPAWAVTWEMAGPLPESNFLTQNIQQFANTVNEKAGGKLKINLHVSGQLVKSQDTKQAVRTGQVPIAQLYVYDYGNENPVFETSTLPFIAGSYIKAWKLWKLSQPYTEDLFNKQNVKVLYVVPWPIQGFYTTKPVKSMADFKNVKFRVYSTQTARLAQLMGADPVQVQVGEIAQAFATGLVGVMYTSPQTGIMSQAWDFAKYFTNTYGGNLSMTATVVNKRDFDRLDQATQKVVLDAARDAQTAGWLTSQSISTKQIKELQSHGMIIQDPSPAFRKNLDKIGEQMLDEWAKKAGKLGQEVLKEFGPKK